MNKEELENQLQDLRTKWKVDWGTDSSLWPKSNLDKRYWKFQTDKLKGESIREQIKKIEAGIEIKAEDLTTDQLGEIFK